MRLPVLKAAPLVERLVGGTATEVDKEFVEWVRRFMELRAQGRSFRACSDELGVPDDTLRRWERRPDVLAVTAWLREKEGVAEGYLIERDTDDTELAEKQAGRYLQRSRRELVELTPNVLAYLRRCLRRDSKGEMEDPGKAMWASEIVIKGTGLGQPPNSTPHTAIQINIGTMQTERTKLAADDAAMARAAKAVEVACEVVPGTPAAGSEKPT